MKNKNFIKYNIFYFIYFGAIGSMTPYINVYLETYRGLTGSQIGLITSLSLMLGVCVVPIWGFIGDKTQKYASVLKITMAACLVVLYFYYNAMVYPAILACAICLEIPRLGIMPMADTIALNHCQQHEQNYGIIRSMGSLGYMIIAMLVGFMADIYGLDGALFASYAFLLIISISIAFTFNDNEKVIEEKNDGFNFHKVKELLKFKPYIYILLVTILSCIVMDAASAYTGNHLTSTLGGSQSYISWLTFSTVLPEVGFLMLANKIVDKIGYKKYFLFVIATIMIRLAIYSTTTNALTFLTISSVHCFAVSLQTVVSFRCIKDIVKAEVFATAITLYVAGTTLARAMYGYVFGFIYELQSSFMIYQIAFIVLCCTFIFVLLSKQFNQYD